tara:strand:+ start:209 stop:655 length:447 start_codon:yes stop_codon:yes gene_type:complete
MKLTRILLILGLFFGAGSINAIAAETTRVQAILIAASNETGRTDSRLSSYEPTLKRILRFESYRFRGQGSSTLAPGQSGHISLGEGQSLELTAQDSGNHGVRVSVIWEKGGRILMKTGLTLRPGVPAVLGGPSTGTRGEVYAVILTAQ